MLLAVALLAGCTSHTKTSAPPVPGVAPAIGPPPTAVLPAGEHSAVHVTAVSNHIDQSNDLLWGSDRQVGPAYDLAVAKEPSSAVISFNVDPSRLAAAVGVTDATPDGLYIQVFEPALGSWIPLRSVYHAASRTVTAVAPHLSLVSLVWDGVKCVVTCAAIIKRFASDLVGNLKEAWSPEQEHDDCTDDADKGWSVQSSIRKLSGCVIDSAASPVVQVENPLLFPVTIRQPPGAPPASLAQQPYMVGQHPELSSLVTGLIAWAADATVIAPRSYGVVPLQDLSGVGRITMATQPDALGMVTDVILGILFALPGEKSAQDKIDDAVKEVLPEFEKKIVQDPGSVSLTDILSAVEENIKKQDARAQGPVLSFAQTFSSAYECANDNLRKDVTDGMQQGGITNGVIEAAANLAKNCVETALKAVGREASHSLQDVLDVIDAIPNFAMTIREGVQFAELGPSAMLAATTAERVPHDLTDDTFEQQADAVCANYNAQEPPAKIADSASLQQYLNASVPVMEEEYNALKALRSSGPVGSHFRQVVLPNSKGILDIARQAQQAANAGDWATVQALMKELSGMDTLPDSERDWLFFHSMGQCANYLSNGTYYVFISQVDAAAGGVWFDRVQYFWGRTGR